MDLTAEGRAWKTQALGGLAIAGFLTYITVTVAFLALRPDLDPLHRVMSNYAVGPNGLLMELAFIASAMGAIAVALLFFRSDPSGRRARAGALLLLMAGLGLIVAASFPTDVNPADAPVTTTGYIHVAAGVITFIALTVAGMTVSALVWRGRAAAVAALVIGLVFIGVVAGGALDLRGLGQRVFVYTAFLWLVMAAYRLAWKRL